MIGPTDLIVRQQGLEPGGGEGAVACAIAIRCSAAGAGGKGQIKTGAVAANFADTLGVHTFLCLRLGMIKLGGKGNVPAVVDDDVASLQGGAVFFIEGPVNFGVLLDRMQCSSPIWMPWPP